MSKVLVLYASHFGQTRTIAMKIAEQLRARGAETDVFDARFQTPAPTGYDAAVIGSRIEVGRHANVIVDYIRSNREVLERMPTAFFSVSMAAASPTAGPDPSGHIAAFCDQVDWKPSVAVALAGALPYRKYNWLMRFIMKRISKAAGHTTDTTKNHEFTDWAAVTAFANRLADLLPGAVVAHRML
jgi:menaquinone-dependent protoporphyrinogen oxidase